MHSLYSLILIAATSLVAGQQPHYSYLGCFRQTSEYLRQNSNEGKGHPELDIASRTLASLNDRCFQVALKLGHNIFATTRHNTFATTATSCLSSVDTVPRGTYNRYVRPPRCIPGLNDALDFWQINPFLLPQTESRFFNLGCFNDDSTNPLLISNEGKGHPELSGTPSNRTNAIDKCFQVATRLNHGVLAVQNGACFSSNPSPIHSFVRYGMASFCPTSGTGANLISNVYLVNASSYISSLGCWNDGPTGGFEGVRFLANISSSVADPIRHCAGIALSRGPTMNVFALQTVPGNSSILKCSAQRDVVPNGSYGTYGAATTCPSRGTGAPGVNHVYHFKDIPNIAFNWDQLDYNSVGCYRSSRSVSGFEFRNEARTVHDCYDTAKANGNPVFFVSAHGCKTGNDFVPGGNYATLGPAPFCRYDGFGESTRDMNTHHVYVIKSMQPKSLNLWDLPRMGNKSAFPFSSIGCAAASGNLPFNKDHGFGFTIEACYKKALELNHNLFGVFAPARCVTSLDTIPGGRYASLPFSDCPSHQVPSGFRTVYSNVPIQLFQVHR